MKARSMFEATLEALAEANRDAGANRESLNTMRAEKTAAEALARDRLDKLMRIERDAKFRQERYEKLWMEAEEFVRVVKALVAMESGPLLSRELYEPGLTALSAAVNASEQDASGTPF